MKPHSPTFFVPGLPVAKGSAKAFVIKGTNRAVVTQTNASKQKPWASLIAVMAQEHCVDYHDFGPVFVGLLFWLPRPKAHFLKSGLRDNAPVYHTNKPDVDKLTRCVLDALTGVAWRDDSQVQINEARKVYAEQPGVWITIGREHK